MGMSNRAKIVWGSIVSQFGKVLRNERKLDFAMLLRAHFNDVLVKMVPDINLLNKISNQADDYDSCRKNFGKQMAIRNLQTRNPIDWWNAFGPLLLNLQSLLREFLDSVVPLPVVNAIGTFLNLFTLRR